MPSRKRSHTPPAPRAPAPAAPPPPPVPPLRETFTRRHVAAAALLVLASIPALLAIGWSGPVHSNAVVVPAVIGLSLAGVLVDRDQWVAFSTRQMKLTVGLGVLVAATSPVVPVGLLVPLVVATVLEFRRGWGAASALLLGAGVAYATLGISPVTSYPYVLGMAWPVLGASVMRQLALAGTGFGPTAVLGRRRW